jgi:hypothetical protein
LVTRYSQFGTALESANIGVNFFLSGGSYAWTTFEAWLNTAGIFYNGHGIDLCFSEAAFGTVQRYLRFANPSLRGSTSAIELRVSQTPGVNLPDSSYLFKELWVKESGEDQQFNLGKVIEVPPGSGILFRPAQPSVYCILNVAGHTEPVT